MKKILSLVLLVAMLFLVSCGSVPAETTPGVTGTTPISPAETTGDVITPNGTTVPSETTQGATPHETTTDIVTPPTLTEKKLYGKIESYSTIYELPSRIIYNGSFNGLEISYYYSKADGYAYYFCFDPLCDHTMNYNTLQTKCFAHKAPFSDGTAYIGGRFYYPYNLNGCYSCSFDGIDVRKEFSMNYTDHLYATDRYIYSTKVGKNGAKGILRYDTQTQTLEDFSARICGQSPKGLYMNFLYMYIYGDKIYFKTTEQDLPHNAYTETPSIRDEGYYEANLDFTDIQESEIAEKICGKYRNGMVFGSTVCSRAASWNDGIIYFYDISKDEEFSIVFSELGFQDITVAYFDEEYIYFGSPDHYFLAGTNPKRPSSGYWNNYGGKYYRMNRDGSGLVLVSDRPDLFDQSLNMWISDGKAFFVAEPYITDEDGFFRGEGAQLFVATIGEDGKWLNATAVEVIG